MENPVTDKEEQESPALRQPGASTTTEAKPPPGKEEFPVGSPMTTDAGLLERTFNRVTKTGADAMSGGGEIVPRKYISFEVDGAHCSPGQFVTEAGEYYSFTLTLASLLSGEEISVVRGVKDPAEAVQVAAKAALNKMNGAPIVGTQLDWFWEALGSHGRQLVLTMYQEIGALHPVGLGKALASSTRS